MNRRTALQCGGPVIAGILAGCSVPSLREASAVTISDIVVRNRLDSEVDVSILLLDAGEVVYWETVPVPADPNPFANIEDLPRSPGEYVLYARVPDTEVERAVHADLTEEATDQSCLRLGMEVVEVENEGTERPTVIFGTIGQC